MTRHVPLAALAALISGAAFAQTPRAADPPNPPRQTAQPAERGGPPATKRPPERGEPEGASSDVGY